MSLLDNYKNNMKDPSKVRDAINNMPGQVAPQFGTETTPAMNQLPMYHSGGDVPEDQVAKLSEGERVLNPVETHAYKSAAVGNAPPTLLGRISDRAHELYDQSKAVSQPLNEEAASFKEKQQNLDAATQMKPLQPNNPPANSSVGADRIHPDAAYGNRPGEQRLDGQGNEIRPTTPAGLGAVGPKLPVPTALGSKLPSYDDGGDVPEDQVAKVHEDEHVLDPEKAEAYRQAEKEVKAEEKGAPADFGGPVLPNPKGIEVKADTDQEKPDYKLQGAKMNTDNAPLIPATMDKSNPPGFDSGNTPIREAKTPLGSKVAPQGTEMKRLPGVIGDTNAALTENVKNGNVETDKAPSTPQEIVNMDKMNAMKSGDLVKLGMAHINERSLNAGGPPALPTPTAPTARENVVNQEKDLRNKMINGATEQERFQAEKDLAELKRRTPWGSEGSAHPGILGKIGHAVSSIAQGAAQGVAPYVLPAVPGSQANIAAQEERGEQGVEQAQGKEMRTAQLATEQQKPEIKQQAAELAEQKVANAQNSMLRKQQLKVDAAGNQVPLTYEELTPQEQGAYDLQQAKSNAQNSISELKRAQADPDSPQSKAIFAKIKNDSRRLDIAAGHLGIDADKYKADYLGVDHDGNPLAGAETDEKGKPVGIKVAKTGDTTSTRLNKADLAQNVQLNVKNATALIKGNPDLFGKVQGRFTNAAQMTGSDDPAIRRLGVEVHNMAVASAGIHGQRGQGATEAYEKDILNKFHDSPDATAAAMDELSGSVQTFIDDAKHGKKVAPTPGETPKAAGGAELTPFQQWQAQQKK